MPFFRDFSGNALTFESMGCKRTILILSSLWDDLEPVGCSPEGTNGKRSTYIIQFTSIPRMAVPDHDFELNSYLLCLWHIFEDKLTMLFGPWVEFKLKGPEHHSKTVRSTLNCGYDFLPIHAPLAGEGKGSKQR